MPLVSGVFWSSPPAVAPIPNIEIGDNAFYYRVLI